ncbi:MAG TPA: glycosyltransferase, partial [Verrucomicrobiae bacterium]
PFGLPAQTELDFARVRELGANLLRVYEVPPRWFLDLSAEHELKLFIDIPWAKDLCFLESAQGRARARQAVQDAVRSGAGHATVFAYSVANEIAPDVVRWNGARAVAEFIDELVEGAKSINPSCLYTYSNFPPTEYLRPRSVDFLCFNVYLHQRKAFEQYLSRLQMIADAKPLVLGEFGMDTLRHGEQEQSEFLEWQIEGAFRRGLAGAVVFSFKDDWFRHGRQIDNWAFGLVSRDLKPKPSFAAVQRQFRLAPHFPPARTPKVSVVVACYNGARTLQACLDSLTRLDYPNYEIILVDDGSTDTTPEIASRHKAVRYLRQSNHGLSVARNTGIAAATGEIVAFTDADCRADEGWLHYLVGDLSESEFTGIGGHNFLPPDDSAVAAAVLVSPGGPAHVMLNDREAEHIPGCNMAFYRWALEEIGGFDPIFRVAGDDVDVCWRLRERGYKIGFSPAGFVWHYRRSTVGTYLKQQEGYGAAEALLARKHPEYFNSFGGSIWRGHIYASSKSGVLIRRPMIYHGPFGTGLFQSLYRTPPALTLMLCTSLEYHVLVTLPLAVLSVPFRFLWPLALTSLLLSCGLCAAAAAQADLLKSKCQFWSRPLIALLYFLQPVVRGWARYQGRLNRPSRPANAFEQIGLLRRPDGGESLDYVYYRADGSIGRLDFLSRVLKGLDTQGWQNKADAGWDDHDVEIFGDRWCRLELTTVAEDLARDYRVIRCRLRPAWSLAAKIAFWALFAIELLIIGVLSPSLPYIWMLLLTMPIFGAFLQREQRDLQRLLAAFLDDVAKQQNMTKLEYNRAEDKFAPVDGA